MCFNSFITIVALKHPEKVKDLLAYSSIIVKASKEFEGVPWLEYDSRFRREAAANQSLSWAVIDSSSWTLCFANANPKVRPTLSTGKGKKLARYRRPPVCRNFNNNKCELAICRFRHVCSICEKPGHTDSQCPESPMK